VGALDRSAADWPDTRNIDLSVVDYVEDAMSIHVRVDRLKVAIGSGFTGSTFTRPVPDSTIGSFKQPVTLPMGRK
jgi:hypothetical protein